MSACGDSTTGTLGGNFSGTGDAGPPLNVEPLGDDAFGALVTLPRLDHIVFAGLIDRYKITQGDQTLIDYDAWAASGEATVLFDQYVGLLARVDPTALADRAEKMAFWFNAYNALTVAGVLAGYAGDETWSVSDADFAFFKGRSYVVGGRQLSLDALENGVLRGDETHASVRDLPADVKAQVLAWHGDLWGDGPLDPRLHMAINCASLGCPNLFTAFRAATLEADLARASRSFLGSARKGAGADGVSQLFTWFEVDFNVGDYTGPADFITRWRDGGLEGVNLDANLDYSWRLNLGHLAP